MCSRREVSWTTVVEQVRLKFDYGGATESLVHATIPNRYEVAELGALRSGIDNEVKVSERRIDLLLVNLIKVDSFDSTVLPSEHVAIEEMNVAMPQRLNLPFSLPTPSLRRRAYMMVNSLFMSSHRETRTRRFSRGECTDVLSQLPASVWKACRDTGGT